MGKTDPEYSWEAKIAKMPGKVQVSLVVGEEGRPRKWRFKPGLKDGVPVPVVVTVTVNFGLIRVRGDSGWTLSRAVFNTPDGATMAGPDHGSLPTYECGHWADRVCRPFFRRRNPGGIAENLHIRKNPPALQPKVQ